MPKSPFMKNIYKQISLSVQAVSSPNKHPQKKLSFTLRLRGHFHLRKWSDSFRSVDLNPVHTKSANSSNAITLNMSKSQETLQFWTSVLLSKNIYYEHLFHSINITYILYRPSMPATLNKFFFPSVVEAFLLILFQPIFVPFR